VVRGHDYIQITATYQVNTITPLVSFTGGSSWQGWNVFPGARLSDWAQFQHLAIYMNEP